MLNKWHVYALVENDTQTVFYIGKGSTTSDRWSYWRSVAKRGNTKPVSEAIRQLWQRGGDFHHEILFVTSNEDAAYEAERELVDAYRDTLINVYDGGRAPTIPASVREKISQRLTGIKRSEEQRANYRAAWTPERVQAYRERAPQGSSKYLDGHRTGRPSGKYDFKSPDGEVFYVINLRRFCEEHGLSDSHMRSVARGERRQHRGWTAYPSERSDRPC